MQQLKQHSHCECDLPDWFVLLYPAMGADFLRGFRLGNNKPGQMSVRRWGSWCGSTVAFNPCLPLSCFPWLPDKATQMCHGVIHCMLTLANQRTHLCSQQIGAPSGKSLGPTATTTAPQIAINRGERRYGVSRRHHIIAWSQRCWLPRIHTFQ